MKHHSLGLPIASFGPHFRVAFALIGIGGLFSWLAFDSARQEPTWLVWTIFYVLAIGFGLAIVRHLAFRLWVHDEGISYRGILGHGEIRWRDVDRAHIGAYSVHFHHVALGDFCRVRLVTKRGEKYSFGERVHGAENLAELIHSYTLQEMVRKAASEFENGVELDFGRIHLNRRKGVSYRKWFAWHEIQWADLSEYSVSNSHVNLRNAGSLLRVNIAAERVANVHVLKEILGRVKKKTLSV